MAGGYSTRRQQERDHALGDRVGATDPPADQAEHPAADIAASRPRSAPAAPRACWVRWSGEPTPGHVLHWHRDADAWEALVVVTLPRTAVTPRSADEGACS